MSDPSDDRGHAVPADAGVAEREDADTASEPAVTPPKARRRRRKASREHPKRAGAPSAAAAPEPSKANQATLEEVEAALQAELEADRRWRRSRRRWQLAAYGFYGIGLPSGMGVCIRWPDPGVGPAYLVGFLVIFLLLAFRTARAEEVRPGSAMDRIVERLISLRGLGAVSTLLSAYRSADDANRVGVASVLQKVLPRLQASDAQYVSPEAMSVLISLLSSRSESLVLAALAGLRQVGDRRAIGPLEALVARPDRPRPWSDLLQGRIAWLFGRPSAGTVEAAARDCLAYIRERREAEEAAALLLRPAESPDAETLLRPAEPAAEVPQEELLRPADPSVP